MLSPSAPLEAARWRALLRRPPAAARRPCIVAGAVALILMAMLLLLPHPAAAQSQPFVRGEAVVTTANGYTRLMIKFAEHVDAQVRVSGNVLVIFFQRPVDVPVDRVRGSAPDYVGHARRDPDGRAVRFA